MPAAYLHIAILELAHHHTIAYLHSISSSVREAQLQMMLYLISALLSKARSISPRLLVDVISVALTFLPDSTQKYTYHHLRTDMCQRSYKDLEMLTEKCIAIKMAIN
jgi:hypothetical protein